MKKIRRICIVFLSLLLLSSSFLIGCGGSQDGEQIDTSKTQIYVGMIDGGFGTSWFDDIEKEFEKLYKNVSFEEGRTGVQILLGSSTTAYMTDHLINNIGNIKQELIFTESGFDFYYDFINQGKVLEITDVVTGSLSEFNETATIESKLPDSYKAYYKTPEGKYYALPNNEATVGIVYNVDLWEEKLLYLAEDSDNGNDGFVYSMEDNMSVGPDGVPGTYDDGLPATYADFYKICDVLKNTYDIDPILWYYPYVSTMLSCMHADYEGEAFMDNFDFSAENAKLVNNVTRKVDPVTGYITYEYTTKNVDISQANGYEVFRQAGRLHALEFLENIEKLGYASTRNYDESHTHLTMHEQFLYGGVSKKVKQAAMLVEGSWWENESNGIFDDMARDYGSDYAKQNRRFGFMPFPKPTMEDVESQQGYTMLQTNRTMVMINAKTPEWKLDLVKKLLAFVNTDNQIVHYTTETNTTRPLKYPDNAELSSMSYFGKDLLNVHNNAKTVFPLSLNELFRRNTGAFALGGQSFYTLIDEMEYNMPAIDINREDFTALEWFEGLTAYRTGQWQSYLDKLG